jgi:hypothetical protein
MHKVKGYEIKYKSEAKYVGDHLIGESSDQNEIVEVDGVLGSPRAGAAHRAVCESRRSSELRSGCIPDRLQHHDLNRLALQQNSASYRPPTRLHWQSFDVSVAGREPVRRYNTEVSTFLTRPETSPPSRGGCARLRRRSMAARKSAMVLWRGSVPRCSAVCGIRRSSTRPT